MLDSTILSPLFCCVSYSDGFTCTVDSTQCLWVACDDCKCWLHADCNDIGLSCFDNLANIDWVCNDRL